MSGCLTGRYKLPVARTYFTVAAGSRTVVLVRLCNLKSLQKVYCPFRFAFLPIGITLLRAYASGPERGLSQCFLRLLTVAYCTTAYN